MRFPRSHLFGGWQAALVAVVAACAAPSAARAGCGDYVVIRDANGDLPATAPDHDMPAPCDGPNCHGAPSRAPIAPVAPPTLGSPKDAVTRGADDPPADGGPHFPIPTSDRCPGALAEAVFHPPRAG